MTSIDPTSAREACEQLNESDPVGAYVSTLKRAGYPDVLIDLCVWNQYGVAR